MKAALLLVDLQYDFIEREGLLPSARELIENVARILRVCRQSGVPVIHSRTVVSADGTDRMPHWVRNDIWACVEGSRGCSSPPEIQPLANEPVCPKQYFSAFGSPALGKELKRRGIDTLFLAGIYTHGCVRATALDAYERGYGVRILADAVASTEPLHAELSRRYLEGRAASLIDTAQLEALLGIPSLLHHDVDRPCLSGACIEAAWRPPTGQRVVEQRNPSNWRELLSCVAIATQEQVEAAAQAARKAQPGWQATPAAQRAEKILQWERGLREREAELVQLMALEIGKPVTFGREEIHRAYGLIRATVELHGLERPLRSHDADHICSRDRPLGVVGVITPWNNPIAIAVGKLAAALVLGNAVIWKPPLRAPKTARLVMETLLETGLLAGVVSLLFGDGDTGRQIIADTNVRGISMTGSLAAGQSVALQCAAHLKPLQAELGGNNAAIVMADCDIKQLAYGLALSAYGFSGQRCTATRRFIVQRSIKDEFIAEMKKAIKNLHVGQPGDEATQVGPLVSRAHRERLISMLGRAVTNGGQLLYGGEIPKDEDLGCWLNPALILCEERDAAIVQTETFGPIAVVQPADDFDHALSLLNHVRQGLAASLFSRETVLHKRFLDGAQVGILKINQTTFDVSAEAPFGGWKASGLGPPEHGLWDADFYTRPQALYGEVP